MVKFWHWQRCSHLFILSFSCIANEKDKTCLSRLLTGSLMHQAYCLRREACYLWPLKATLFSICNVYSIASKFREGLCPNLPISGNQVCNVTILIGSWGIGKAEHSLTSCDKRWESCFFYCEVCIIRTSEYPAKLSWRQPCSNFTIDIAI